MRARTAILTAVAAAGLAHVTSGVTPPSGGGGTAPAFGAAGGSSATPAVPAGPSNLEAGYTTVAPGAHLFHVLARSQRPGAPLVVYVAGGPGASSMTPVFVGNGPWRLRAPFRPGRAEVSRNPWSWTRLANVVYLDQPRHTGFSTGRARYLTSVRAAGRDFSTWLRAFRRDHPQLARRKLILAGESFAGTYISEFTRRILDGDAGRGLRLAGLFLEAPSLGDTQAAPARAQPDYLCARRLVSPANCTAGTAGGIRTLLHACATTIPGATAGTATLRQVEHARSMACRRYRAQVTTRPSRTRTRPFPDTRRFPPELRATPVPEPLDMRLFPRSGEVRRHVGFSPNPYDTRRPCRPSGGFPPWCYRDGKLTRLLNAPATKAWIGGGIRPARRWRFADFRVSVTLSFKSRPPSNRNYARALRRGVPVLLAFGAHDWDINPFAARHLVAAIAADAGPSARRLTHVELPGAGHMLGLDRPRSTYRLMARFLDGAR
ncbi:S10 family peptidase [Capillimicrobium parvum]|uniref:Peptidase S10 n=1 Tax=Capillimicrobium parvum TaxID=2884022 RepID=A0A9E6Y4I6_9ACTN|nr:S10 family peptidase [Capillimicrobium parvum]UGS39318.1 hypothetical protein DSM104329_05753 [Capillimicrobium parvum]